ncbi:replication initiation protein RepC [Pararhizobium capsulatum DSM 1112]|uniref:Replication initiation protein RepC n=1 Tax=Pararhizobium capsulatum DSM 1112 TaxID=1121113 RepID=A0ABU0BV56_9HYPH|nr:plasmid replication protein RepC [Pararhizobium capsulatum]MDQ0322135.1 replication initiation protein RepC [Pararhizobium capsulatum DSM 1112]
MERLATTPFGGAPLRAQTFALQTRVARRQEALKAGEGGNDNGTADKWQLIRALTEAREVYALSDRSITVLEALTSFHPERTLNGAEPIIVFPSNAELSMRTRGMSPATLRRHIAFLVEAGFVLRRDSPNGKRFCRRDDHGQMEDAFGFDLAPLALAAADIHAAAERVRAIRRVIDRLRAEVTLHLRDISKLISSGLEEGRAGDWMGYTAALASLSGRVRRNADQESLEARREGLMCLRAEVENAYPNSLTEQEMSANDSDSERHIQNSNTDQYFEESGKELKNGAKPEVETETEVGVRRAPEVKTAEADTGTGRTNGLSLKRFLALCPEIANYAKHGIRTWRDAMETAELVRSMLGVSPDAWAKAKTSMGDTAAAVTIAFILERAEGIRSPGGYLRDLTRKAESGQFSISPMLKALANTRTE